MRIFASGSVLAHLPALLLPLLPWLLLLLPLALQQLLPRTIPMLMRSSSSIAAATSCPCLTHDMCVRRGQLQCQLSCACTPVLLGCCVCQFVRVAVDDNAGCFCTHWHELCGIQHSSIDQAALSPAAVTSAHTHSSVSEHYMTDDR